MLIDLAKHAGKSLAGDFANVIKPEYQKYFYKVLRETPNFFKHADEDPDADLHVGNIATLNVMMLGVCITHYYQLFNEATDHMHAFTSFMKLMFPDGFVAPINRPAYDSAAPAFLDTTPRRFFEALLAGEFESVFPHLTAERAEDAIDNATYYDKKFGDITRRK